MASWGCGALPGVVGWARVGLSAGVFRGDPGHWMLALWLWRGGRVMPLEKGGSRLIMLECWVSPCPLRPAGAHDGKNRSCLGAGKKTEAEEPWRPCPVFAGCHGRAPKEESSLA